MRTAIVTALITLQAVATSALSVAKSALPAGCDATVGAADARRTVVAVPDASTLVLDDGREVRLAGLLPPSALDSPVAVEIWPPQVEAMAALSELTLGRTVVLSVSAATPDRYGRIPAQLHVEQDGERIWVQGLLLARGHARAATGDMAAGGCVDALLARERTAIEARAGLWAHAAYRVRQAYRTRELMRLRSTYQIVTGRVRAVAAAKGSVFLNFGHDWKSDFTVGIKTGAPPADAARTGGVRTPITQTGLAALAGRARELAGRNIRVRGWIERRNGPYVEIAHPAQLELLDAAPPPASEEAANGRADELATGSRNGRRPVP